MLKVISNGNVLKQFIDETIDTLSLWKNAPAVERIKDMADKLDTYYGADRDIVADLGGYIVILYGESCEVEKEYDGVLQQYSLQQDLYEVEEKYQDGHGTVVIRLYLCSSDYAVAVVIV